MTNPISIHEAYVMLMPLRQAAAPATVMDRRYNSNSSFIPS